MNIYIQFNYGKEGQTANAKAKARERVKGRCFKGYGI